MRWDLIDKFEILKKSSHARALKLFVGDEDFFEEHYASKALVPDPFFIEMIAQAGGVLFGLELGFNKEVILAKIEFARFFKTVTPPCQFIIEASLTEAREDGAWISGAVWLGKDKIAEAKLLLVAIEALDSKKKIVFNDNFLKHYDVFEVAKMSEALA